PSRPSAIAYTGYSIASTNSAAPPSNQPGACCSRNRVAAASASTISRPAAVQPAVAVPAGAVAPTGARDSVAGDSGAGDSVAGAGWTGSVLIRESPRSGSRQPAPAPAAPAQGWWPPSPRRSAGPPVAAGQNWV